MCLCSLIPFFITYIYIIIFQEGAIFKLLTRKSSMFAWIMTQIDMRVCGGGLGMSRTLDDNRVVYSTL